VNERIKGRLIVVVGGQFGSEGKGHLTAQLAARSAPRSLVVRVGGPNAGHTVWQGETEYKLRTLPTPVAVRDDINIALGAKSVVNPMVLRDELALFPNRTVFVDPMATILEPDHIQHEVDANLTARLGSTAKGIGAARADRIERVARTARDLWADQGTELDTQIITANIRDLAYATLMSGSDVIVEAAQGYGLGLHTDFYPFCTSADCTALDALAEAQISPWAVGVTPQVWMAVRPFPIRVAGNSGPLRDETSWDELGLAEERTTVTNKVRRVGLWDGALVRRAAIANGVYGGTVRIGLMMADQVIPELVGVEDVKQFLKVTHVNPDLDRLVDRISNEVGAPIGAVGTGPRTMVFASDEGLVGL
jgi:adenylosuccinate synthase